MQHWSLIQNQPLLKKFSKRLRLYHTKEVNRSKTYSSEQNFKGSCVANVKPRRGVCVGLSMPFSLEKTCDVIGSVHPVPKCSKRSKPDQSQSGFGTVQVNSILDTPHKLYTFFTSRFMSSHYASQREPIRCSFFLMAIE